MTPAVPSPSTTRRPLVLVPACSRMVGAHPFHIAGQKYIDAVRLAGCMPLVVPAAQPHEVDELLDLADGVFLTGSPSNVHPRHFDEVVHDPALPLDPERDDWTLPLIPRALERGFRCSRSAAASRKPTSRSAAALHQAVQEQPGLMDHRGKGRRRRSTCSTARCTRSGVEAGGVLETLLGPLEFQVNIAARPGHQAPGRRAAGRGARARWAGRGLSAGGRQRLQPRACNGIPNGRPQNNPISVKLLRAFGDACRTFRERNRESVRERPRVP